MSEGRAVVGPVGSLTTVEPPFTGLRDMAGETLRGWLACLSLAVLQVRGDAGTGSLDLGFRGSGAEIEAVHLGALGSQEARWRPEGANVEAKAEVEVGVSMVIWYV